MGLESVYNSVMAIVEYYGFMVVDWLNMIITFMVSADALTGSYSDMMFSAGLVYGFVQLVFDVHALFPFYFQYSLSFLIVTFFVSMLINFLATIWRVIPFT
jgi:hypothetical protein